MREAPVDLLEPPCPNCLRLSTAPHDYALMDGFVVVGICVEVVPRDSARCARWHAGAYSWRGGDKEFDHDFDDRASAPGVREKTSEVGWEECLRSVEVAERNIGCFVVGEDSKTHSRDRGVTYLNGGTLWEHKRNYTGRYACSKNQLEVANVARLRVPTFS